MSCQCGALIAAAFDSLPDGGRSENGEGLDRLFQRLWTYSPDG